MALTREAAFGSRIAALALLALAAAASHAEGRFTISSDGHEVTDSTTGLIWRRCGEGTYWDGKSCNGKLVKLSYAGAKQAVEAAKATTGKPWRIPSREELVTLYDVKAKKKPKVDGTMFPKATNGPFWATRAGTDDNLNAWLVNFGSGTVRGYTGQSKFPLRLVRAAS